MTISRAQIPSLIDPFATGGDVSSPKFTVDNMNELSRLLREGNQLNYSANVKKYQERLEDVIEPQRKMSIYDVASDLGAGILSTPNTGGASIATGLTAGFTRVSDRMKQREEEGRKLRQQMAMQATQMAQQDETKALDFLRQIDVENIKMKNQPGDFLTFVKKGEDGEMIYQSVRDNAANNGVIEDLISDGFYVPKSGGTSVTVGGAQAVDERDKEAIKAQNKQEEEIYGKRKAGQSSIAQVDEAIAIAERLGEKNFGAIAKITMYPRELLDALGFADKTEQEILGDQKLLSQISMGFTMDIVSRTKGAISNKEMEMFISASPGLGSNYNGFMKQAEYLRRISQRDIDFGNAYTLEAEKLEDLEDKGELSASQVKRKLSIFEGDWYDKTYYDENTKSFVTGDKKRINNVIFTEAETKELEAISQQEIIGADGTVFEVAQFAKSYREKQNTPKPSNYEPRFSEANELINDIQNSPDYDQATKNRMINQIKDKFRIN